jgi:hypothetical protein
MVKKEATANHGKTKNLASFHPPSISCMAVKASPAVFCLSPQVHRTGSKVDKEPRLKTIALRNMKERN